jgi:hypothetical protein
MKMRNLDRFRVRGGLRGNVLHIPIPKTADGRVYRYSPNDRAYPRHFVLGNSVPGFEITAEKRTRMKHEPGTPGTICPYSGVLADDEEYDHPEDLKAAFAEVQHALQKDVSEHFDAIFSGMARHSGGKISYKKVERSPSPRPRFARRDLMRLLVCDCCGRDYGVFAIALFCPDCGAPNIALHFAREIELVNEQVDLAESLGKEKQELAYRLLGNAHEDVLTAFEATLKTIYLFGVGQLSDGLLARIGNDFQNIKRALERFAELSIDPFAALDPAEISALALNIQKRHVIGHNLGVVDAKFVKEAGKAKLGETVKLVGDDIRSFAEIGRKVIQNLDDWLAGQTLPPGGSPVLPAKEQEGEIVVEEVGRLSPLATKIGRWISERSENGLPRVVDVEALVASFPKTEEVELGEALAELGVDGFVQCSRMFGARFPRVHSTDDLFLTFDPLVHGSDPIADSALLAELVSDGRESVDVANLHKESGLPLRRFNPAIALVIAEVDERRVSAERPVLDYPTGSFLVFPEDRVAIRRLLHRLRG